MQTLSAKKSLHVVHTTRASRTTEFLIPFVTAPLQSDEDSADRYVDIRVAATNTLILPLLPAYSTRSASQG